MPERAVQACPDIPEQGVISTPPPRTGWRWGGYAAVALACALVFGLYVRPDMMVTLADQLWACF